jgi:prepilin-type processing-associated H-X9-DG protein
MDENLVAYLLGALSPEQRRQVEAYVEADPAAREQLEALRRTFDLLAADRGDPRPPADLAKRTLARVAELSAHDLPRAPTCGSGRAAGAAFPLWRRADVLVAACLLVTALGLLTHWVLTLRRPEGSVQLVACKDNLRKFYFGLKNYSARHNNQFPNVAQAADSPKNVAGLVVPILLEDQALAEPVSVSCPANGPAQECPWTLRELRAMSPEQFRKSVDLLASGYAYSLGYRSEGRVVGLRFDPDKPNHRLPVMADCPPVDPSQGNSPNHGSKGQNVLFMDGHVEFCTMRNVGVGGDDIFLNKASEVAAGLDWMDSVLGRSSACAAP